MERNGAVSASGAVSTADEGHLPQCRLPRRWRRALSRVAIPSLLLVGALPYVVGSAMAADGNPKHGEQIAQSGVKGVQACVTCHGPKGIGDGSGAFPRLTGQVAFYVYKELTDFAAGARPSPIMQPVAKGLSDQDRQDVAAYYASVTGPYYPTPKVDEKVLQHGGKISAAGLPDKSVPACIMCHGRAGFGNPPLFPYLAGQYANYLQKELELFKSGARHNDPLAVMRDIASKLSHEDITAVSHYFASVRPVNYQSVAASATGQTGGAGASQQNQGGSQQEPSGATSGSGSSSSPSGGSPFAKAGSSGSQSKESGSESQQKQKQQSGSSDQSGSSNQGQGGLQGSQSQSGSSSAKGQGTQGGQQSGGSEEQSGSSEEQSGSSGQQSPGQQAAGKQSEKRPTAAEVQQLNKNLSALTDELRKTREAYESAEQGSAAEGGGQGGGAGIPGKLPSASQIRELNDYLRKLTEALPKRPESGAAGQSEGGNPSSGSSQQSGGQGGSP